MGFLYALRRVVVLDTTETVLMPTTFTSFLYALRRDVVLDRFVLHLGKALVVAGFYTPFGVTWFWTIGGNDPRPLPMFLYALRRDVVLDR